MSEKQRKRGLLREVLQPLFWRLPELVSISFFANILSLAVPVFVLQVYDRVVFQAGLTTLQGLVAGVLIAVLFDFMLRQLRGKLVQRIAIRVDADVGRILFGKLANLPLAVIEGRTTPQWQALHRDSESVRNIVAGPPLVLMIDLPFVAIFIGVIWVIAAPVAWVLTLIVPVFLFLAILSQRMIAKSTEKEREATTKRDVQVAEMIFGRATMKSLGVAPSLSNKWEQRQADLVDSAVRRGTLTDTFSHLGMSLGLVATIIMTSVGALAIIDQELTMGALIAANMLTNKVIQPMSQLVGMWRQIVGFRSSAKRLNELLNTADEAGEVSLDRPRPRGEIILENATFGYGKEAPAISSVSARFEPGVMHGIIGPNGGGKTTLLKLMQRLYPLQEGSAAIDGVDMTQLSRAQIARWVGYVPQDPFLFSGSIRDNIAKGQEGVPDEAILQAARLANVESFIDALPDGYGTDIGESGRRLSTGQRQRIAIARAMLDDPPILLLDEPSANLDRAAENHLAETLSALSVDHTVVVVSHSPGMLDACGTILVLQDGRVLLSGSSDEVKEQLFGSSEPAAPTSPEFETHTTPVKLNEPGADETALPSPSSGEQTIGEEPAPQMPASGPPIRRRPKVQVKVGETPSSEEPIT